MSPISNFRSEYRSLVAVFAVLGLGILAMAQADTTAWFDPAGDWLGTLKVSGVELRLVFHIQGTEDGLTATLDSVDQGANGIPVSRVSFKKNELVATVNSIGGTYRGQLQEDGTFKGTWSQGAMTLPLSLERQAQPIVFNRPQEPKEPFPYRSEEVTFDNQKADVKLSGTLTLPEGDGPFPAVVLISGSGPQDRDEAIMGHRPFWVIADHLTREGIAVLRYDDRGSFESTGDFGAATSRDFADDARAAVEFLGKRQDIGTIGLAGHSEGGLIAPLVAIESDDVGFIVLLAGPGTTGREILLDQTGLLYQSGGLPEQRLEELRNLQGQVYDKILADADKAEIAEALEALIDFQSGGVLSAESRKSQIDSQLRQLTGPWFRFFLAYDPVPTLAKVEQPVLALNGAKDFQVPAKTNLDAIRSALTKGGNGDFEVLEMENLNHLFQTSQTGMVDEYSKIEETVAPVVLKKISSWILSKTEGSKSGAEAP